jgi:hypothetical protein
MGMGESLHDDVLYGTTNDAYLMLNIIPAGRPAFSVHIEIP